MTDEFDASFAENTVPSRSAADIVQAARWLRSESGENPEYDRALVNMVSDLLGFNQDDYARVAAALGIPANQQADDSAEIRQIRAQLRKLGDEAGCADAARLRKIDELIADYTERLASYLPDAETARRREIELDDGP